MGWATKYIDALKRGDTVQFRPEGGSMAPWIKSGQLVTVEPATVGTVKEGDKVLCVVNGNQYLHFVRLATPTSVQIGNARGRINGWTSEVYGKVTAIED